jgi:hypothetical protein
MALRMAKQEHTQAVVDLQRKVEDEILDEVSARVLLLATLTQRCYSCSAQVDIHGTRLRVS